MNQDKLKILLDKYHQGTLSTAEGKELNDWFHDLNLGGIEFESWVAQAGGPESYIENRFENFKAQVSQPQKAAKVFRLRWAAVAASITIVIGAGSVYLLLHKKPATQQISQNQIHDIAPGGNKATLTLSDGRKIILSDAHNGTIASQGQTLINKTADGKIVYLAPSNNTGNIGANTLITARGEQSSVTLSDGTIAYLNAASSIKYPVNFIGNERRVEITGEVLFEVVHKAEKPFRVTAKGQTIEDIGTQFDINAYDDEPLVSTTLISGSAKISVGNTNKGIVLKPGQEAVLPTHSNQLKVLQADIEKVTAWKNGNFVFTGDNIEPIMRQVARWYNVDVDYQTSTEHKVFVGSISRFSNVSEVLKTLEITGTVHFKIEGRRIIVMP